MSRFSGKAEEWDARARKWSGREGTGSTTAVAGVSVCLWVCAVLLVGAYHVPGAGFPWDEPFEWARVVALIPAVRPAYLHSVLDAGDCAFFASVIAWWALLAIRPSVARSWAAVGVVTVLLFPMNLLGLLAAAVQLLTWEAADGEYLGEQWPIMQAYGLWFAMAVFVAGRRIVAARSCVTLHGGRV
jgi:hypothetical protein